jgi:catechol 2,3-dioxygenase-like lactoylglutathione lyase family enzyme
MPWHSQFQKNSIDYWLERLKQQHVPAERTAPRFEEELIRFIDPDGVLIELIESPAPPNSEHWHGSSVAAEHSIRGFHSVSAALEGYERTAKLLTESFGYRLVNQSNNRFRFVSQNETAAGRVIDLLCIPDAHSGRVAAGSVHHIAFRARDDAEQRQWREHLVALGYNVTPVIDRIYFHSIYFREPGGILFEIATDPPGFTFDEDLNQLGESLRLPPWLEPSRAQIEKVLPPIALPTRQ